MFLKVCTNVLVFLISDQIRPDDTMAESNFELNLSDLGDEGGLFSEWDGETDVVSDASEEVSVDRGLAGLRGARGRVTRACQSRGGVLRLGSRHPTARHQNTKVDLDLLPPEQYLQMNKNGNSKKNEDVALKTYDRVMSVLLEKSGEVFDSLQEAPVDRLPYLLQKFLQAARKPNGDVYASGTITTNFHGLCNVVAM